MMKTKRPEKERTVPIYRYGLCTLVHYHAAKKLVPENENLARLLASLLATTYAVFKHGGRGETKGTSPQVIETETKKLEDVGTIEFGGFEVAYYPKDNPTKAWLVRYPHIATHLGEFDRTMRVLEERLPSPLARERLKELVLQRVGELSEGDVRTRKVFDIYRQLRDDIEFGEVQLEPPTENEGVKIEKWTTPFFTYSVTC